METEERNRWRKRKWRIFAIDGEPELLHLVPDHELGVMEASAFCGGVCRKKKKKNGEKIQSLQREPEAG